MQTFNSSRSNRQSVLLIRLPKYFVSFCKGGKMKMWTMASQHRMKEALQD